MTFQRSICIAAEPALTASLAEQFAALGRFTLCETPPTAPDERWPHALALDESRYGLAMLALARGRGSKSFVVLIADAPKAPPAGVDAVIARPFRFVDLVALIDLAPRAAPAVGPYRFEARELRAPSGARLKLTEKEAAILARLAQADGAPVSREALLRDVWGYAPSVSTRTLETHIHRLRRKLEPSPANPRWLVTEGAGYRLAKIARRDGLRDGAEAL